MLNFGAMTNIAIIGCGLIGRTHAECLAKLGNPPRLFVDTDLERAADLAAAYSARASNDLADATGTAEIDAIYICTYHDTHAPLAIAAAKSKKHIFLEKPIAITERDCRAIVEAVNENGVHCMAGFKLHYSSLARTAKELIKTPQMLFARVMEKRWPDDSWANDPAIGGGNVLSQGCHAVELLCYLAGAKPMRILADGGNLRHPKLGSRFVDSMSATISFDNGAIGTLLIGDAGEMPHDGKFDIQAMNGRETIHLFDRFATLSYFNGEKEHIFSSEEDGFLNENKEFLSALSEERTPETNELDGLRAEMILLRGIESLRTHQPQSLLDLP